MAAYFIWEKEGRMDGHDIEHWQRAEALLLTGHSNAKAATSPSASPPSVTAAIPNPMSEHTSRRRQAPRVEHLKAA